MRRDVFQAIADPTRRQILDLIVKKPLNLNAVADEFEISRPAISKHIRILRECGLLMIKKTGRERYCYASLIPLKEVADWTAHHEAFWNLKLDALDKHLNENKALKI